MFLMFCAQRGLAKRCEVRLSGVITRLIGGEPPSHMILAGVTPNPQNIRTQSTYIIYYYKIPIPIKSYLLTGAMLFQHLATAIND